LAKRNREIDDDNIAEAQHNIPSKSRSKYSKRDRGGISRKELDSLAWSLPLPHTPPPSLPPMGATSRGSLDEDDEPHVAKKRNEPHSQETTEYARIKRQPDYDFDN